jgi:UDPglucose 6-dehydrogenase
MHCVIAGAGYVGVTTALVLVEREHTVHLVDIDETRAHRIAAGEVPFVEPGVDAALKNALRTGRLSIGTDLAAATSTADAVFLCVGTPSKANGEADLTFVKAAAKTIGQGLRNHKGVPLIVTKSTVPPGTTLQVVASEVEKSARKRNSIGFHAVSNPEFLREGRALEDARTPDRVVVGALHEAAHDRLLALWKQGDVPVIRTDPTTAELIKYASNAFLALKISFSNEVANLCAKLGVDVYDVMTGVGLDKRIGSEFLRAGVGFGGSCFPKDVRALDKFARRQGVPLRLPKAVLEINEQQPMQAVKLLESALGDLKGKKVALLGVAFKPDTDDVRETRALPIYRALVAQGAQVTCWDPVALANFQKLVGSPIVSTTDLPEAIRGKNAAIIQTEWPEIRRLPPSGWLSMTKGAPVVDGRRSVDAKALKDAGVRYLAIGGRT